MNSEHLPSVLLSSHKRYSTSIPEGKASRHSASQIPIITKRGPGKPSPISMREIMTDPSHIDQKLKSLSHGRDSQYRVSAENERKQKSNFKFLKYKFNPGSQERPDNLQRGEQEVYGQLGKQSGESITINAFYEHRNVLFQDDRAPLVYKKLFMASEEGM